MATNNFRNRAVNRFLDRQGPKWKDVVSEVISDLTGDFEQWDCFAEGHTGGGGSIYGFLESWTGSAAATQTYKVNVCFYCNALLGGYEGCVDYLNPGTDNLVPGDVALMINEDSFRAYKLHEGGVPDYGHIVPAFNSGDFWWGRLGGEVSHYSENFTNVDQYDTMLVNHIECTGGRITHVYEDDKMAREYEVLYLSSTQVSIKKNTAGTADVHVNIYIEE